MQIVEFLRDYWSYISSGILVLLSVILAIIKNRPSAKDVLLTAVRNVLTYIPTLVCMAEERGESGNAKKEYVLCTALDLVEEKIGRDLTEVECKRFYKCLSGYIETILDCPTKKGGFGREEDVEESE